MDEEETSWSGMRSPHSLSVKAKEQDRQGGAEQPQGGHLNKGFDIKEHSRLTRKPLTFAGECHLSGPLSFLSPERI